ncbi:serine hydrolase domain-containing protein [candidate division KSB1 bacterium]
MNCLKNRHANLFIIFPLLSVLIFSNCTGQQHTELRTAVQAKLDEICQGSEFPGATLGIVLDDNTELIFVTGLSDVENNIPMKPSDRMFTGSQGKTFVAGLMMQLHDEKKLSLDDRISKYLGDEEWFSRIPNHEVLTVRMLMHHTGGLPRYVFKPAFIEALTTTPDKTYKPEELLSFIFDDPPMHEPDKGWAYSDTDFIIIGMIIEKICGSTYYSELEKRILKPFKLKDTIPSDRKVLPGLIPGYTADKAAPFFLPEKVQVDGELVLNPQFEWCGGGLITTSMDLARWAKLLYEAKVFSQESLNEMLKPVNFRTGQPDETGYGLGVFIFDTPSGIVYGHHGVFPGYETAMFYLPEEQIGIALQINADSSSGKLNKQITHYLFSEIIPVIKENLDQNKD